MTEVNISVREKFANMSLLVTWLEASVKFKLCQTWIQIDLFILFRRYVAM